MSIFKRGRASQILTTDQQEAVKFNETFYTVGLRARRPYEKQWYVNMAFFLDQQWLAWDDTRRRLEMPVVPSWRKHITINKIKPNVLHILAKLTKNKPIYQTIPATTEDADLNRAKISLKVHQYLHRINQMDILNQRLVLWYIIFGTAFKEPYFDKNRGMIIPKTLKKKAEKGPDGEEKKEEYYNVNSTGEVGCEILSPFSIIPEQGMTDLKQSLRVMKIVTKSLEYIKETYPAGHFVQAESQGANSSIEKQLIRLLGEVYETTHVTQSKKGDQEGEGYATIKELRELPTKQYPKGRLIRVAGGVLLDGKVLDLPFDFMVRRRTFGIVQYDYTPVGERFWGDTPVTSMVPINAEFNKTISQIIEIKNLMGKPKWIIYKQNNLIKTAITSEPGEVLEVTHFPGVPDPHPIDPPNLPNYILQLPERNDKDMEDVSLIHEVSKGVVPPGVTSGVAIQFLQEQDQTVFGPVATRFETSEGESGTYELEIVKERYTEERTLQIVGENNEIEVFDFMSSPDMPTDVIVQSGSSLPHSLVAKQQLVLQFYEKGMLGDPADPQVRQKAMKLAEVGGVETIYEEAAADEKEAEREQRLWEKGIWKETPVNYFDNHATHTTRHLLFCKSDRYRELIKRKTEMIEGIEAHIKGHIEQDPAIVAAGEQRKQIELEQNLKVQEQENKTKEVDIKARELENKTAETVSKIQTDIVERGQPTKKGIGGTGGK